jgi:hypothetical protein
VKNADVQSSPKKRVKFDEAKFFDCLKGCGNPGLLSLLRSVDPRAGLEMASYVIGYLRRSEEEVLFSERRKRAAKVKRTLSMSIASLQRAATSYRELAAIQIAGRPLTSAILRRPGGVPNLADLLDSETERLQSLLAECKRLYGEKRFGVSGNHFWLVMLEEFVSAWTSRELGKARRLRPAEIAALITAGKMTLGWRLEMSEIDPELISKAIRNFRSNAANALISNELAKSYARERCRVVNESPYLLGIEI